MEFIVFLVIIGAVILYASIPLIMTWFFNIIGKALLGTKVNVGAKTGITGKQYIKYEAENLNETSIKINKKKIEETFIELEYRYKQNPESIKQLTSFRVTLENLCRELWCSPSTGYFPRKQKQKDMQFIESYIEKIQKYEQANQIKK